MTGNETGLSITTFNQTMAVINNTNTIPDARKLIAIAQGFVETARKLYNAASITSIMEAGEDKNHSQDIAKKAGELKLYAEARMGELIKVEQEAGRLAGPGNPHRESNYSNEGIIKTFQDYGLTAKDSYHAQQLAENKDVIAQVVVDSLDIPTRAAVEKEIKKRDQESKPQIKPVPMPVGLFDVIYADPPWKYDFSETDGRSIENQYPTMELEDIKSLSIPACVNSVLLLWATAPKLIEALEVMQAWGFTYKTNAVWDKDIIGMGYWFRGQHELLLVGVKGEYSPPAQADRFSSVIKERRTTHSKKPLVVYEMIEKMLPREKYLELFARDNNRDKWSCWGNNA